MKITKAQLKRLIKEELEATLGEGQPERQDTSVPKPSGAPRKILVAFRELRKSNPEAARALYDAGAKHGQPAGKISRGELDPAEVWNTFQRATAKFAPNISKALLRWLDKFPTSDGHYSEGALRQIKSALGFGDK
jgi:hypothetical protein